MDAPKIMRSLLVGSSTLLAVVAIYTIQSKFEGADRKAAVGVVQQYRSHTGWTIPEILDQKHPGQQPAWQVKTESSCLQHEKVTAAYKDATYEFMVDINGPSIHPGNKASETILQGLDAPARPGSSSASAPAAPPPKGSE